MHGTWLRDREKDANVTVREDGSEILTTIERVLNTSYNVFREYFLYGDVEDNRIVPKKTHINYQSSLSKNLRAAITYFKSTAEI